ncbi:amino acid ABC transporter substrate-binding protein (PAAT family) [Rhizobium subbaraonis]|uniref:Amino acid ABC transporter substrate-binding protein (PAAT family) n=1 Tax=Rhizobium subbaraonis TaxID=908946 RepID=A0A285UW22_9HYPH|nr:transporter substrate-binding domain-containing protein [Rhizobium subbaraonis]SOC45867.1 amino acid ABC transporter substrate-binding protein (PAAT family) [Rhizobium subbaraonis]
MVRMGRVLLPAFLVAAFAATIAPAARAAEITLVTEEYAPYNYSEDGVIKGIAVDQVHRIAAMADITYRMEIMPWARALMLVERQTDHCVFTTGHNGERHARFRWVEPLLVDTMVMVKRRGSSVGVQTLEDARRLRVGAQRGDFAFDFLKARGFADIDLAAELSITLGKLENGRIDLMPTSLKTYEKLVSEGAAIDTALMMDGQTYGLACNLNMASETVEALQAALDTLIESGEQDAIFARYGLPPTGKAGRPAAAID